MGVDTKLYLNTKWRLDDIKTVVERIRQCKVEVQSNHTISTGYFNFILNKGRMIHVHTQTDTPVGISTLLSMSANDESHDLFKAIAEVFGGIFMDNDCDGECEMIHGKLWEEDALPYFLKYAIVDDNIKADDTDALVKSIKNWHEKYDLGK